MIYLEKYQDIDEAKKMTMIAYKDWRRKHSRREVEKYLKEHKEGQPLCGWLDGVLLRLIYEKCERKQHPVYREIQDMIKAFIK